MDTSVGNIILSPSQAHHNNRKALPFWILRESSSFLSLTCTGHPNSSHRETGRRTWNWVAPIFRVVSFTYRTACHGSHKLLFPMERTAFSVTGMRRWDRGRMEMLYFVPGANCIFSSSAAFTTDLICLSPFVCLRVFLRWF